MMEHILAAVKPVFLKGFSTLDPLVANIDDDESSQSFFPHKASTTISRVARLLNGEPNDDNLGVAPDPMSPSRSDHSNSGKIGAATTLEEGAVPVRELPDNLTSEPASLCPSSASSLAEEALKPRRYVPGQHQEELRCVIAVIRHGDRTPKQKLKVNMTEPLILKYFHDHSDDPYKDLKVKAKAPMTEFLETVKTILANLDKESKEVGEDGSCKKVNKKLASQLRHMRDVLERWKISGLNRKLQIKPRKWNENEQTGMVNCTELQLILKWGGNLTKLGEKQAINLGQRFRHDMYPDAPGGGILRLHSTFRHDLKIKTSDEGRVMKTAAAFAKGLLELEGEIPPILVSLVHKEKGSMHMLDPSGDKDAKLELDECKERITANLQRNIDYRETTEDDRLRMVGPPEFTSMRDALAEVGNPRKTLMEIHKTMGELIAQLEEMLDMVGSGDEQRIEGGEGLKGEDEDDVALSGVKLYKGETLLELTERWRFIYKRLYDCDDDVFDLSRIPDVHDNVRFDVLHNPHLGLSSTLEKLYELAKSMADCVVPQEYGTTVAEKRSVGVKICSSLLEKIMYDLCIARTDNKADMRYMINLDYSADLPINTMGRRIRTRLYFTSESHLHTMLNVLRFACCDGARPILSQRGVELVNQTRELCYLTQIVIRLFEDTSRSMDDPRRFRVEILFSPGADATPFHMDEDNRELDASRFDTAPLQVIGRDCLTCKEVEDFFGLAIMEGRQHKEEDMFDVASASTGEFLKHRSPPGCDIDNSSLGLPPRLQHIKIDKSIVPDEFNEDEETASLAAEAAAVAELYPSSSPPPMLPSLAEKLDTPNLSPHSITMKETSGAMTHPKKLPVIASSMSTVASDKGPKPAQPSSTPSASSEGRGIGSNDPLQQQRGQDAGAGEPASKDVKEDRSITTVQKYFWSTVAMGSLLLGTGCLVMALSLSERGRGNRRRYASR